MSSAESLVRGRRRKEEFESKRNAAKDGPSNNKRKKKADQPRETPSPQEAVASTSPQPASTDSDPTTGGVAARYSSIAQVKTSAVCPGKFLVRARIVDFYPPKISAFRVRKCTQCKAAYVHPLLTPKCNGSPIPRLSL